MRTDISQEIISKTSDRLQTSAYDSDPKLSLVVSRKEMFLDDFDFTERRRARRTTKDSISDIGIAVCHSKLGKEDESVWICYCKNNKIYLRYSYLNGNISDVDWDEIDLGEPSGTKCDIGFFANANTNMRGGTEYVTSKRPAVFYIDSGSIKCIDLSADDPEPETLWGNNIKDMSVRQTPLGLGIFYVKSDDEVYYRIKNHSGWGNEEEVDESLGSAIDGLSTFNINDGFGIQAHSGTKLYRIIGDENLAFDEWFEVDDANGTGVIVEYPDGQREAFFDADINPTTGENGGFMYSAGNDEWYFAGTNTLYSKHYSVIEFDHTNSGTVYFTTLFHSDSEGDIIYFLRYMYAKDVSAYTQEVTKTLQVDNPISQINAELKNIDDSLYTSNATLFAPSSMMRLGIKYGSSDMVDLGIGYIDQATFEHGGDTVTISGRNRTGVFLRDQSFGEDMEFNNTPYQMVSQIMEIFGLEDCYECDDSEKANGTPANPRIITMTVEAKTTGLKALQTLNELLTDDSAGDKWDFEELPDGTIIIGYDDFRSQYSPKSSYVFNGISDVFAKTIDRSIDGVYTKVRCTGKTPAGKGISYTYNVTNFRFWNVGENRIYHAPHVDGITKSELKKYAKALAKQLKYIGRIITYRMNLKPQLVIGDVAKITYGQDEGETEQLGSITEIIHSLGENGYFTEFTVTSGGDILEVSPTKIYTADKSETGANRKKRMSDYLGGGGDGSSTSISSTIINGDSVNLPELIRNFGFRLLDEPTDIKTEYDLENNAIKLKWADPDDIATEKPVPATWAGTVVVRSANGDPLHRWDGLEIVDSTTRNEYKNSWLVDDTDIEKGVVYYYAIMPYDTKGDYRWTKVVAVRAGDDLANPVIEDISMSNTDVVVTYSIPTSEYSFIKLVYKKDSLPLSVDDGTAIDITQASTSQVISDIADGSTYWFVIFTDKTSSEPKMFTTEKAEAKTYTGFELFDLRDVSGGVIQSSAIDLGSTGSWEIPDSVITAANNSGELLQGHIMYARASQGRVPTLDMTEETINFAEVYSTGHTNVLFPIRRVIDPSSVKVTVRCFGNNDYYYAGCMQLCKVVNGELVKYEISTYANKPSYNTDIDLELTDLESFGYIDYIVISCSNSGWTFKNIEITGI